MTSAPAEKEKSIAAAAATTDSKYDHLSAPASAIVSGTATPAEKEEEAKKESNPAERSAKYDHLSAPASAIQSGTATPAEPAAGKTEEKQEPSTHRGSDVVEAPSDEVKKVESQTAIGEEPAAVAATEGVGSVSKGVEGLQVGDGKTVGQQEAKKAEDAVKSVED